MKKKIYVLLLGLLTISSYLMAQQRAINGRISDAGTGDPIPAVTIKVSESGVATTSDQNGNFSIQAATGNTLLFTAVGYEDHRATVGQGNVLNVVLTSSNQELDEVIVVAYGTANRRTFTGSAATVSAKEIKDASSLSFEGALLGKLPGVQITTTSGQAGSSPSIRVRGIGSMNASNAPLYVIDGVPTVSGGVGQLGDYIYTSNNVMNNINPSDIESISVLKDAAAASLYGSRAANGVVIIQTKQGALGKPRISFRTSYGITPDWAYDNYEVANTQDNINMMYQVYHDYRTSAGWTEERASADAITRLNNRFRVHGYSFSVPTTGLYENVAISGLTDGVENRDGKFFNWEDVLFRTGTYQTHDLSISGGNENSKYYTSFAYTKEKNRVVINAFDRITGRVNLTQKVASFLESNTNISISHNEREGFNDTRNLGANYFMQSRNLLWGIYWPTDYKTGLPFTSRFGSLTYNPTYYQNEWDNSSMTTRLQASQSLNARLFEGMQLKSIFSYEQNNVRERIYYSPNHYNASTNGGSITEINTLYKKLVSSTTANYNVNFGSAHNLDLLAGFEAEKNDTDYVLASGTNLPSTSVPYVVTAGERNSNSYAWGNTMMSIFSRAEYSYNRRYNLSASYRTDGSSRLSPEVRWGDFWSVGASWAISEEDFLKGNSLINNLRLKASHGINGTLPGSNYGWRNLVGFGSRYMETAGGSISTLGNENLTWETNYNTNLGLDFGLLNNRLYGTFEVFNRDTRDVLQSVPISRVTGFSSILRNIGKINNKGLEVSLGYDIIRNTDWKWSVNANLSAIKTKVVELYKEEGETTGQPIIWSDPTGGDGRATYIYQEGGSMLAFYGKEWAGVEKETGDNLWYVNDPENPDGDFLYNGKGATKNHTKAKQIVLGSANPKAFGGFNTEVEYRGISLGLNFIYKIGGKLYDGAFKDPADDGYYWERTRSQYYFDNRWTESNPNAILPRLSGQDWTDPMQISSRQLHDASFLRLKNINLAYTLPQSLLSTVKVSNARVYFNGTNLLTFAKYKIADPEVNNYGTRGWETPFGKTYTFGLEFTF